MTTILVTLLLACAAQSDQSAADAALTKEVRAMAARWNTDRSPGGVVCVLRGGEPILLEAFGMADLEEGRKVTAETPFYLASLAKPLTAYCAVHAARAGKLDLDAPLRELFPELPKTHGAATLRHAIHHASGLPDVYDAAIASDMPLAAVASNERAIELLTRLPKLNFTPGESMVYSNSGYVLLAEAIERATQQSLAEYARAQLFEPLGMQNARFLGEEHPGDPARSYQRGGVSGWTALDIRTGLRGPGGLLASMEDLVHFEQGFRALDDELRSALLTAPYGAHPNLGQYAAGWMLQRHRGLRVQRHPGGGFGFSSDLLRFPDQDVTIIALSNAPDLSADDMTEAVAGSLLADVMSSVDVDAPRAVELTPKQSARFGRLWRSPSSGAIWILSPRTASFVLAALGDLKIELVPVSATRLEATDAQCPFAVELEGADTLLVHWADQVVRLERLPFPVPDLPPASDFAGEYYSALLDVTIGLQAMADGRVRLYQEDPIVVLPPFLALGPDLYFCDRGARIDFRRDEAGRVSGLTMHANRAWGLEFERAE